MLREQLQQVQMKAQQSILSTAGIQVEVETNTDPCPLCKSKMNVQKSTRRTVITLEYGEFVANETIRVCSNRCYYPSGQLVTRHSNHLSRLVQPYALFGYDVEVFVGMARFLHHQQREEIQRNLFTNYGITISTEEVSALAYRFLKHIGDLHKVKAPLLKQVLASDGGFPLHIDATGEIGRGTLLIAYAGWRQWVLGSWKISSERSDLIRAALMQIVEQFGLPLAVVRDMGKGMICATDEWSAKYNPTVQVLVCHAHFLDDVGKDLLGPKYDELRRLLRHFKIRSDLRRLSRDLGRKIGTDLTESRKELQFWIDNENKYCLPQGITGIATVRMLCQWILDYHSAGQNQRFPFELPYLNLSKRCQKVRRAIDAYQRIEIKDKVVYRSLIRLARIVDPVISEVPFAQTIKSLEKQATLFQRLRKVLRMEGSISSEEASEKINNQFPSDLEEMQKGLEGLTHWLKEHRPQRGPAQETRLGIDLILDHLERHGAFLWGHEIQLPEEIGGGYRLIARTNNTLEGFNRKIKHGERRRSGRKILSQDLEHLPAEAALVANLNRLDYVQVLCGSLNRLPDSFAELDLASKQQTLMGFEELITTPMSDDETVSVSFPKFDQKIVREQTTTDFIESAAISRAPRINLENRV